MRIGKLTLLALSTCIGCIAIGLVLAWRHQPSSAPMASITLIGYRNITLANPDTNVFVYPGRGGWLRAQMKLKNEGTTAISYPVWGDEPFGWANAHTHDGMTNCYLAPPFTGGTAVLYPGSNASFWVMLPVDTLRWECGFSVETPSPRERAIWSLLRNKIWNKLSPLSWWSLRLLSNRAGPSIKVQSGSLDVGEGAGSPAQNQNIQPTGASRLGRSQFLCQQCLATAVDAGRKQQCTLGCYSSGW